MRTSWQKYLPPNWAPMPVCCASASTFASSSTIAERVAEHRARRSASASRYLVLASLAVSTANSADVPPITTARWYGGHADGAERLHLLEQPRQQRLLVEQRLGLLEQVALVGAATALGDEQELVGVAVDRAILISAGRLLPVFFSSYIVSGAIWL